MAPHRGGQALGSQIAVAQGASGPGTCKEVAAVEKPRKPAPVVDLMAALKESLAQIPKKPAERVVEAQVGAKVSTASRKTVRKRGSAA